MNNILFLVGVFLLTFGVTYSLWVKVRVIRLRQDIYDQRDALFDIAASLGACSDPSYREARQHLNSLAFMAKDISVPLMLYAISTPREERHPLRSPNGELQEAIEAVFEWSAGRIYDYLMNETLHGWALRCVMGAANKQKSVQARTMSQVECWIRSDAPVRWEYLRQLRNPREIGKALPI